MKTILFLVHLFKMSVKKDVLCVNEVVAAFQGIEHLPCHFMTAKCPDHCDHATDVANFHIEKYEKYEKLGKYGDDKQEDFYWDLKKSSDSNKEHPEYIEKVKALKPGQKVKIHWTHYYVHDENGASPERTVTYFEAL